MNPSPSLPNKPLFGGVCFITDRGSAPLTCIEMTLMALRAGIKWIQYRRKDASRRELYSEALILQRVVSDWGALLTVNDHADIASMIGAVSLHVGQEDLPVDEARKIMGPDAIIGVSTHSIQEAREAQARGADYIGFGPVFRTATKDAGSPKGIEALSDVASSVSIPVVAIGGIGLDSLSKVFSAGASAVAVASALLKEDAEENAALFMRGAGEAFRVK